MQPKHAIWGYFWPSSPVEFNATLNIRVVHVTSVIFLAPFTQMSVIAEIFPREIPRLYNQVLKCKSRVLILIWTQRWKLRARIYAWLLWVFMGWEVFWIFWLTVETGRFYFQVSEKWFSIFWYLYSLYA